MIFRTRRSAAASLWIINHYAGPPRRGDGTRHHDLARQLYRRGYAVTIFASSVCHSSGVCEKISGFRLSRDETVDNVRYVWIRGPSYRGNALRRVLNVVAFAVCVMLVQARRHSPQVVVGSTVHPLAAVAGYLIAKARRARFYFEVRDLWPQTLIDMGALGETSLVSRALRKTESFLVTRSRGVITVLPGMASYLREQGLHPRSLLYLPNGVDLEMAGFNSERELAVSREIAKWRVAETWICLYLGTHGRANSLRTVLEAARLLQDDEASTVRILLVGDGPEKSSLVQRSAELGLHNVAFADPVPKSDIPALLALVDAGLVQVLRTPIYRYGMSFNKLFDYMASAKPVVFACDASFDPVAENDAGATVAPEDPAALAAALRTMSRGARADQEAMGRRGRAYVEREHDIAVLARRLAEFIE